MRGAVIEEVEFGDALIAARFTLHENLPDERSDCLDGARHGEKAHERKARVRQALMDTLTDGPDFRSGRESRQGCDRIIGHHVIKLTDQSLV